MIDIELSKKDWQQALLISAEALKQLGPQPEIYFLMGYSLYNRMEIENAISCFEKAIDLKPYLINAMKNSAKIHLHHQAYKNATPFLKKILKIVPHDLEARFLLEEALRKKEAQKEVSRLKITKDIGEKIKLKYRYIFATDFIYAANIINTHALSLVRSGQLNEAISWIRNFLELNDLSPGLNYNLGLLYNTQDVLGKALKYAWRTQELKKDFKEAYDLVGNIFFKMRDFDSSLKYYQKAVKIDPEDAVSYYNLGCVYSAMKDFKKAEEHWKNAIRNEKEIRKGRKREKSPSGGLDISLIVEERPISFEAHKGLGNLYLRQELLDKSLMEFKKAIELEPADPEPYYKIGTIFYTLRDMEKASLNFDRYIYLGGEEEKIKEYLMKIKE